MKTSNITCSVYEIVFSNSKTNVNHLIVNCCLNTIENTEDKIDIYGCNAADLILCREACRKRTLHSDKH